jgi:hypothetical protein
MFTQNHWVCRLCPSSGILMTRKNNISETGSRSSDWGVSHPSSESWNRSSFWNVMFSSYLEFWTMDKVHNPSDSECYTPSSEPFIFYMWWLVYSKCSVLLIIWANWGGVGGTNIRTHTILKCMHCIWFVSKTVRLSGKIYGM